MKFRCEKFSFSNGETLKGGLEGDGGESALLPEFQPGSSPIGHGPLKVDQTPQCNSSQGHRANVLTRANAPLTNPLIQFRSK